MVEIVISMNPLNPIVSKSEKVSLRTVLVLLFVVQIFFTAGIVGYISFRNGQRAVTDVAKQLLHEVTERVEQNLRTNLTIPHQVNQINAAAMLNLQDFSELERYFWREVQIFDNIRFAGTGLENKDNIGAERLDDGSLTVKVSNKASGYEFRTYSTNQFGDRLQLLNNELNFDPRTRPWYKAAVTAGKSTWSEIYPNPPGLTSYLDASMPFYDKQGQLRGVLHTNINLSQIGTFLKGIKIGKTGQVFIIDRSGMLVAASTGGNPFSTIQKERFKATDSSDNLTKATAQYLATGLKYPIKTPTYQPLEFEIKGQRQFLQLQPFQDKFGLDWLIVAVVPEADFMEQINANTRHTIFLGVGALIFAIILGIVTSSWIGKPILTLSIALQAIASGELNQNVEAKGIKELMILAESFNSMAHQLQKSFAALEAKNADLKQAKEEADYRSIFENTPDGIFQSTPDGYYIRVNPAMADLYGYKSPAELMATVTDIGGQIYVNPNDREEFKRVIDEQGEVKGIEYQIYRQDGSVIWVSEFTSAVRDANGQLLYYTGIVEDITQRKQREEELERQIDELRIEIDKTKQAKKVAEIVETDSFHNLKQKIKRLKQSREEKKKTSG